MALSVSLRVDASVGTGWGVVMCILGGSVEYTQKGVLVCVYPSEQVGVQGWGTPGSSVTGGL